MMKLNKGGHLFLQLLLGQRLKPFVSTVFNLKVPSENAKLLDLTPSKIKIRGGGKPPEFLIQLGLRLKSFVFSKGTFRLRTLDSKVPNH